jgi:hypothetical protein
MALLSHVRASGQTWTARDHSGQNGTVILQAYKNVAHGGDSAHVHMV